MTCNDLSQLTTVTKVGIGAIAAQAYAYDYRGQRAFDKSSKTIQSAPPSATHFSYNGEHVPAEPTVVAARQKYESIPLPA
jgi:hypothetical protein